MISKTPQSLPPVMLRHVVGCARCGGNHRDLSFNRLTYPCGDLTYWATCPTNGEPILMQIDSEEVGEGSWRGRISQ